MKRIENANRLLYKMEVPVYDLPPMPPRVKPVFPTIPTFREFWTQDNKKPISTVTILSLVTLVLVVAVIYVFFANWVSVKRISVQTGLSSTGGLFPTISNTGVLSVDAGTGCTNGGTTQNRIINCTGGTENFTSLAYSKGGANHFASTFCSTPDSTTPGGPYFVSDRLTFHTTPVTIPNESYWNANVNTNFGTYLNFGNLGNFYPSTEPFSAGDSITVKFFFKYLSNPNPDDGVIPFSQEFTFNLPEGQTSFNALITLNLFAIFTLGKQGPHHPDTPPSPDDPPTQVDTTDGNLSFRLQIKFFYKTTKPTLTTPLYSEIVTYGAPFYSIASFIFP